MKSLEKIKSTFKRGIKKAELEEEIDRFGPFLSFKWKEDSDTALTNLLENQYEKITQELEAIPNPKGIVERIFHYLGQKYYESIFYIP